MSRTSPKANRKLLTLLVAGSIAMFGFGFALVPLYDVLCQQLGINGKTNAIAVSYEPITVDKSRTVTVEFMTQIQQDLPWRFTPEINRMQVHPEELIRTHFAVRNLSLKQTMGQAIPSVSPGQGAAYFHKTECFCFNQQQLSANAEAQLPLIFYIDPDLPKSISTLTLSYTLYNITDKGYIGAVDQGAAK